LSQQIKYGKIGVKTEDAQKLGNFTLDKNVNVSYNLFHVFKFHAFKQIKRGDTIVRANVFGYVFTNPINGMINNASFAEEDYPEPHDFKDALMRECVRIINDDATEDKPSLQKEGQTLEAPSFVPLDKLQKDVFEWMLLNLIVKKKYYIQSAKGYDSGAREAVFTFKKKDFLEYGSVGCFAVPLFHLAYKHPNSTRTFKRETLGCSGEIIGDELKCSKSKLFGKCESFPDNVCSVCGNPFCNEHGKQCEKCGAFLCKDCVVSKGLISKHYFCSKCAS